jgi:hypothetical protein
MTDPGPTEYGGQPGLIQPKPHDPADYPGEMLRMIYATDPDPDVPEIEITHATDPPPLRKEDWGDPPLTKRIAP